MWLVLYPCNIHNYDIDYKIMRFLAAFGMKYDHYTVY